MSQLRCVCKSIICVERCLTFLRKGKHTMSIMQSFHAEDVESIRHLLNFISAQISPEEKSPDIFLQYYKWLWCWSQCLWCWLQWVQVSEGSGFFLVSYGPDPNRRTKGLGHVEPYFNLVVGWLFCFCFPLWFTNIQIASYLPICWSQLLCVKTTVAGDSVSSESCVVERVVAQV